MLKNIAVLNMAILLTISTAGCGSKGPSPRSPVSSVIPGSGISEYKPGDNLPPTMGQTVYVPVYPFAFTGDSPRHFNLTATVYIRNTDRSGSLYLTTAKYHDGDGKLVREFLPSPLKVAPLATLTFFVPESDVSGGPASSMIVEWSAAGPLSEPIIEALMIGTASNQGIAFTSPGRVVAPRSH